MERAYSLIEIKSVHDDEWVIEGIASTPTPDRSGDVVEPMGAKFSLPMPLLWQHQASAPVGHVEFAKPTKSGIPFRARIVKASDFTSDTLRQRALEAWESVKSGLVGAVSIGFKALKDGAEYMDEGGRRFKSWEWLELSLVTIPANAEATIQTVKSIDAELRAAPGHEQRREQDREKETPGASGTKTVKIIPRNAPTRGAMNIAEQIQNFEHTRAAKAARRTEIQEKAAEEGRSKDEAEREEFDTLTDEIKSIDRELADLKQLEKDAATTARPVQGATPKEGADSRAPAARIVVTEKKVDPGIRFARVVKTIAWAHRKHRDVEAVAREMYADDALVQKAAVAAGTTVEGNWAANLVSEEGAVFADFVEFLRPTTILGKFGAGGIPGLRPVDFYSPLVTQTGGGEGYWVGEGKAKPLTSFGFSRRVLTPLKVANIAVLSEENIRASSPKSDVVVRDSLAAALRQRLDVDFINPDKAPEDGVSPGSILYGVDPIASVGTDADAVRADLGALLGAFISANNPPTSAVVIMPALVALTLSLMRNALGQREFPDITMNGGTLEGLPVITSENVTSDDYGAIVAIVNASDIYLADDGGIAVDTSREASLEMDNAPSHNSGTPTAAQLVSMFQTNSVAIRAERTINWARRRDSAVAWVRDVLWTANAS